MTRLSAQGVIPSYYTCSNGGDWQDMGGDEADISIASFYECSWDLRETTSVS